jgi:hypothetical protein
MIVCQDDSKVRHEYLPFDCCMFARVNRFDEMLSGAPLARRGPRLLHGFLIASKRRGGRLHKITFPIRIESEVSESTR